MTATTSTTEPKTESPADERSVEQLLALGRIAIHDPAIVEDNGTYYVFGTQPTLRPQYSTSSTGNASRTI